MNMLVFLQAAPFVANKLGTGRFFLLFFGSAVGAAVAYILINAHAETPAIGASGAVCGVFGAYFLSVRRSWRAALADRQVRNAAFMFLFINVFLAGLASVTGFLPIAWEAHLGGFVAGVAIYPLLARRVAHGPWG
jgi:membrane associated rhomboid family serine protease